jgi:hypothetical protein
MGVSPGNWHVRCNSWVSDGFGSCEAQANPLPRIQAAQRGLEQRAADVDATATATATMAEGAGDAGAVPGFPAPAANGSARPTGMAWAQLMFSTVQRLSEICEPDEPGIGG